MLVLLNLMTIATYKDFKDRSSDLNDTYDFDEDDDVDAMMRRKIRWNLPDGFCHGELCCRAESRITLNCKKLNAFEEGLWCQREGKCCY